MSNSSKTVKENSIPSTLGKRIPATQELNTVHVGIRSPFNGGLCDDSSAVYDFIESKADLQNVQLSHKVQPPEEHLRKGRGKKGALNTAQQSEAVKRSQAFKATRRSHTMEAAEDYTKLILDLEEALGEARIVSIAAYLGVSHVTALRTVNRLQHECFLKTSPHKPVELTLKGKKLAKGVKSRHTTVYDFLIKLGVSKAEALCDAEGIEHHVGPATLAALRRFLDG
jgi:DtxR family transcriptional regulator, manganese transport regulator